MFTTNRYRKSKPVSHSAIDNQRITLKPEQFSAHDIFFGGRILQHVEDIACLVAEKHVDSCCVTKGIDFVRFYAPVKRGDVLVCSASVNRVWDDSMEVGMKVMAEDFRTLEHKNILAAYFLFSSKEEDELCHVIPETKEQKKRYFQADIRRNIRSGNRWKEPVQS